MVQRRRRKRRNRIFVNTIVFLLAITIVTVGWIVWEVGRTYDECFLEAGGEINVSEFFVKPTENAWFSPKCDTVDVNIPGDYHIYIKSPLFLHSCILHIKDTVAPKADPVIVDGTVDEALPATDFVKNIVDKTDVTIDYVVEPDFHRIGKQDVLVSLTDLGGNETRITAKLVISPIKGWVTITSGDDVPPVESFLLDNANGEAKYNNFDEIATTIAGDYVVKISYEGEEYESMMTIIDNTPPIIEGVKDRTIMVGQTIAFKQDVNVIDIGDPNPVLTVEAEGFDVNTEGEYTVVYTATDASGNSTTETCTVYVNHGDYDVDVVNEYIDKVIAKIITDDMTDYEKTYAVWRYAKYNVGYRDYESVKVNPIQATYYTITLGYGDCYSYASMVEVLLNKLGIKNMMIMKDSKTGLHYWNLVDLGEGWYHCDSTPRIDGVNIFMWDDATLMDYSGKHHDTHGYDREVYTNIN